jgi:hypothetical protein
MSKEAVTPLGVVDTPLLKFESNWMGVLHVWPITTMQFYTGDPNAAATYLKTRLLEVAKANPWIGSTIVKDKKKHGKLLAIRYSISDPPIDDIFEVNNDLDINENMPYGELQEKMIAAKTVCLPTGAGLIKSGKPVCKLTVAPRKDKSGFAVIFSMSHTVGDGHTHYAILNMLSSTATVKEMQVVRKEEFSMEGVGSKITGEKEFKFMMNPGVCMMCYYIGIMMRKKVNPECYLIDAEKLKVLKESAKSETGAAPYVSTNDIITSGFGRATKAQMLTMPVNIRGKEENCSKDLAGNYWTGLMFGADALSSPNSIRHCLNGQAPHSRVTLPSCCIKGNWSSMITNWSSMSDGSLDIPDCTQTLHLPYLNTKEMLEDGCVVFKARPNQIAVMLFLHSVSIEDVKKELPLGEKVSQNMFG